MTDDLMKLMGWLEVKDITPIFDEAVRQHGKTQALAAKTQAAIDKIMPKQIIQPWNSTPVNATGRLTVVSASAATAPGSVRTSGISHWSCWDDQDDRDASCTFYKLANQYIDRMFNPGRTITAASELEDEPAQPGFEATGPRDDFAGHMAYKGLKPGTPEWDDEARAWIEREESKRAQSGELLRASRLQVRDANIQRYRQSDADRLIEEMMQ